MSEYDYSDLLEDEPQGQQNGGKLRKMLEDQLSANKKLTERLDRLESVGATATLLKEKGIDPAVIDIIPSEVDPKEWLEKYAGLFGVTKEVEEVDDAAPEGSANQGGEVDAELDAERAAMETLVGPDTGIPSNASADQIAKLKSFKTEEELLSYIQSGGAEA